jgi:hypothetical protein
MNEEEAHLVAVSNIDVSRLTVSCRIVLRHKEALTVVKRFILLHDRVVAIDRRLDKLNIQFPLLIKVIDVASSVSRSLNRLSDFDSDGRNFALNKLTSR